MRERPEMSALRLRLTTATTALFMALTSIVPAQALTMPATPQAAPAPSGIITDVQYRERDRWDRRDRRRGYREGYYNGHRGYRHRRPGYRYHNGYWFPLAAFAAGAIIGGATQARPVAPGGGLSSRHYAWCESRYRTYRASDNTYVASAGVRRYCNSPY